MNDKDYVAGSERYEYLMGIYRQLKRVAQSLKEAESRAWKGVDVSAAKILREARKERKTLKMKRVRRCSR